MYDGTYGHGYHGHGIAYLWRYLLASYDLCAYLEAFGGEDVLLFPIGIMDKGDEGAAVGVVFYSLHCAGHVILFAGIVDDSHFLLVSSAYVAHGHLACIIPTSSLLEWC